MRQHKKASIKTPQVVITLDALIHRINRKLAHNGEQLCVPRSNRWWTDLGDFYISDFALML